MSKRVLGVAGGLLVVSVLAACVASATTTVTSACYQEPPFVESVPSSIEPVSPRPGETVTFQVRAGQRQQDTGPLKSATYRYPLPAAVAAVTGVTFPTDSPSLDRQTWVVGARELVVTFLGPAPAQPGDPSFIGNNLPAVRVQAVLAPGLAAGTKVDWKPAARWEWQYAFVEQPRSCLVADPGQVLQSMTVR